MTSNLVARFMSKVIPEGDCLVYTGKSDTGNGYGRISGMLAHRFAYALGRELDPNLDVLHTCDNRRCVKQSHLYQGTNDDNIRDRVARGRSGPRGQINAGFHHSQRVFDNATALRIKDEIESGVFKSHRQAADHYGVGHTTIDFLMKGKHYRELNDKEMAENHDD